MDGGDGSAGYPPAPWRLRGQAYLSVWRLPVDRLPAPTELANPTELAATTGSAAPSTPAGLPRVRLARTTFLVTAWIDYEPGGVLSYREVLAATILRRGARPVADIIQIWVDDETSLTGGRELWGLPKQRADITISDSGSHPGNRRGSHPGTPADTPTGTTVVSARAANGALGEATFRLGIATRRRLPASFRVVTRPAGAVSDTPVTVTGRLQRTTAAWRPDPDGLLGYLADRRPLVSVALRDFRLRFGQLSTR